MDCLVRIPGYTCLSNSVYQVAHSRVFRSVGVAVLAVGITAWLFAPPTWVMVAIGVSVFVIALFVQFYLDQSKKPLPANPSLIPSSPERPPLYLSEAADDSLNLTDTPFGSLFGMERTFHIGLYKQGYPTTKPVITVKLPPNSLSAFPEPIQKQFVGLEQIELSFAIHKDDLEGDVRNLITHPLVCTHSRNTDEVSNYFSMGIFAMKGATVRRNFWSSTWLSADTFSPMKVCVHSRKNDGLAFSPCNCQFQLQGSVSSFFTAVDMRTSAARDKAPKNDDPMPSQNRGAACFHIVCREADIDNLNLSQLPGFTTFFEKLDVGIREQMKNAIFSDHPPS